MVYGYCVPPSRLEEPEHSASLGRRIRRAVWTYCPGTAAALFSLGHLYGDRTKVVPLGNVNAAMAQNGISGGDMEMEVRQQKMDEIIGAVHAPRARAERKRDLTLGR